MCSPEISFVVQSVLLPHKHTFTSSVTYGVLPQLLSISFGRLICTSVHFDTAEVVPLLYFIHNPIAPFGTSGVIDKYPRSQEFCSLRITCRRTLNVLYRCNILTLRVTCFPLSATATTLSFLKPWCKPQSYPKNMISHMFDLRQVR